MSNYDTNYPELADVDPQDLADWVKVRRSKRLVITQAAIRRLEKQGQALGWDMARTIRECAERSWGGLSAAWIEREMAMAPKVKLAASHINEKERPAPQQPQLKLVSTEGKAEAAKAATSAMRDKLYKG